MTANPLRRRAASCRLKPDIDLRNPDEPPTWDGVIEAIRDWLAGRPVSVVIEHGLAEYADLPSLAIRVNPGQTEADLWLRQTDLVSVAVDGDPLASSVSLSMHPSVVHRDGETFVVVEMEVAP